MNLEEFKKALSSDATEENKQLKKSSCRNFRKNTAKSFQTSKMKTIRLKKVARLCATDASLLRMGLCAYFVVLIIPALICQILKSRWL